MRTPKRYIFTCLFLLSILLAGCASSGSSNNINTEAGATEDLKSIKVSGFVLGIGDTIDISVYRNEDLKRSVKIDSSGMFMFPLIGDVQAAGKDIFKLRDEMQGSLSKYLVAPEVTINVSSVQSQKIMVLGEVNKPGVFALDRELSVMEAISNAGGMTNDAKLSNVLLIRRKGGKSEIASLDMKKAFKSGDLSNDMVLRSGDIVYLPAVTIANVSWYFGHLSKILSPIVNLESGIVLWPQVESVLRGESTNNNTIIPIR